VKVALKRGKRASGLFKGNQAWPDNQVVALSGHYNAVNAIGCDDGTDGFPSLTHLKDRVLIPGIVEKIWKNLIKIATVIGMLINTYW